MTSRYRSRPSTAGRIALGLLIVCAAASVPRAGSIAVFGPETFTRKTGKPIAETRQISVPNTSRQYTLHAENHRVESAIVRVNETVVLRPEDFGGDKDDDRRRVLERRVALRSSNQLS